MSIWGEGWYADPQDKHRLRWWDGSAWTERTLARTDDRPDLPRWWSGVSVGLQLAFLLSLAAAAFTLYVDLAVLGFVDDVRLRPDTIVEADGARIDRLMLWTLVQIATSILTGVLFVAWLYTVHQSSRMDRSAIRHRSGWAIGGWFVPVLNLWRPFQMVTDVRRGATGRRHVDVTRTQGWWWGTWLASWALSVYAGVLYDRAATTPESDPDGYLDLLASAASWERFSCALTIVAALLGILLVREIRTLVLAEPAAEA